MRRDTTSWISHNLGMEMPMVAYGHAGYPLLMFPTAAADYLEYERFLLVDVIKPFIESGSLRAYSINSVNRYSLLNEQASPQWKAELLTRYDQYIIEEVMPLIRDECGQDAKPLTTGASLGAFLAANCYFKHPDQFRGTIAMSGSYDISSYLKNYFDDNVYFNNPMQYVANLNDNHHLPTLQKADSIVIVTGQGAFEAPERTKRFCSVVDQKGIPHLCERWGHDVNHDWDWWRKMLTYYVERFLDKNFLTQ